jgi:hypothetical protein
MCRPRSREGTPLVMWLCVNTRSFVPFNELILGWEVSIKSHSN